MKKLAKWLGMFAVLACLCVAMVACGSDSLEGKYSHSETSNGVKATATINLKKDGVCEISQKMGDVEVKYDGTYTVDENNNISIEYTTTANEELHIPAMTMTLSGTVKKGKSITVTKMNGVDAPAGQEVVYKR